MGKKETTAIAVIVTRWILLTQQQVRQKVGQRQ